MARNHHMFERGCLGHRADAHAQPSWAALHVDDRMVTVFSGRRRCEADNVLGLQLFDLLLEGECRSYVSLVLLPMSV
jgi:hypothetical protein